MNPLAKLRPQDFLTDRIVRKFCGRVTNPLIWRGKGYSWSVRLRNNAGWLENFAGHLHYRIGHAPRGVRLRWKQAAVRWEKRTHWWKAKINSRI